MQVRQQKRCPMCQGPGELQGVLGVLAHYRCRNCGAWFSKSAKD